MIKRLSIKSQEVQKKLKKFTIVIETILNTEMAQCCWEFAKAS